MKLFYINVIEQNAGWGAEWFINRGFINNNVDIINLDYRKNKYLLPQKFLELSDDFDAALIQRGDYFPLKLLRSINRPRFFWASELVLRNRDQDRLFKSGLFDHVFVRGEECKKILIKNRWLKTEQISILLSGFDEKIHRKIPGIKKDIDVVFVGSVTSRRRRYLDILKKHFDVKEYSVFGEDMVQIFNRSKIVLNIHAENFLDTETRIFEAIGCSSLVISEKLSSENPFESGKHLIETDTIEDMISKIGYYLNNVSELERIAEQGHAYGLLEHTYSARAKFIQDSIEPFITKSDDKNMEAINKELIRFFPLELELLSLRGAVTNKYHALKRRIKKLFL